MTEQKRILIIQHTESEGPGRILNGLMTLGLDHVVVRSDLGHPLPDNLAGYAGLVIMGGPQSARELHLYPYLEDEMTLLPCPQ